MNSHRAAIVAPRFVPASATPRKLNANFGQGTAWFLRGGASWEFVDAEEVSITPNGNSEVVDPHRLVWGRIGRLYGNGIYSHYENGRSQSVVRVDVDGVVIEVPIGMVLPLRELNEHQRATLRAIDEAILHASADMLGDGRLVTPEAARRAHGEMPKTLWVVGRSARQGGGHGASATRKPNGRVPSLFRPYKPPLFAVWERSYYSDHWTTVDPGADSVSGTRKRAMYALLKNMNTPHRLRELRTYDGTQRLKVVDGREVFHRSHAEIPGELLETAYTDASGVLHRGQPPAPGVPYREPISRKVDPLDELAESLEYNFGDGGDTVESFVKVLLSDEEGRGPSVEAVERVFREARFLRNEYRNVWEYAGKVLGRDGLMSKTFIRDMLTLARRLLPLSQYKHNGGSRAPRAGRAVALPGGQSRPRGLPAAERQAAIVPRVTVDPDDVVTVEWQEPRRLFRVYYDARNKGENTVFSINNEIVGHANNPRSEGARFGFERVAPIWQDQTAWPMREHLPMIAQAILRALSARLKYTHIRHSLRAVLARVPGVRSVEIHVKNSAVHYLVHTAAGTQRVRVGLPYNPRSSEGPGETVRAWVSSDVGEIGEPLDLNPRDDSGDELMARIAQEIARRIGATPAMRPAGASGKGAREFRKPNSARGSSPLSAPREESSNELTAAVASRLTELARSNALKKFYRGSPLTFEDASKFWRITPKRVSEAVTATESLLGWANEKLNDGTFRGNPRAGDLPDVSVVYSLLSLHRLMVGRFREQIVLAESAKDRHAGASGKGAGERRKPNSALGWGGDHGVGHSPDEAVRFRLRLPAGLDGTMLRVMGEEGLVFERPFGVLQLGDDALIDAIVQRTVDAMLPEDPGVPWDELTFNDGSAVNDPGLAVVTVHGIAARPGGLFGEEFTPEVTVQFPPASRYFPRKENGRAQAARAEGSTRFNVWLGGRYVSPLGKYLLASAKDAAASYLNASSAQHARIDREVWDATGRRRLRVERGVAIVRRSDADFLRRVARYRRGDSAAEIATMRASMRPGDRRPAR